MKQSQWHTDPSKSFYVLNESGHVICNADTLANAKLIAAAPTMAALLQDAKLQLSQLTGPSLEAYARTFAVLAANTLEKAGVTL